MKQICRWDDIHKNPALGRHVNKKMLLIGSTTRGKKSVLYFKGHLYVHWIVSMPTVDSSSRRSQPAFRQQKKTLKTCQFHWNVPILTPWNSSVEDSTEFGWLYIAAKKKTQDW